MKSIFKATAILGSSSVVSVVVGLISSKFLANVIGPAGIGYLGMLQVFLASAAMISGLGIATGTVRTVAKAIADNDEDAAASYQKAAVAASLISGLLGLILIVLFRDFLNRLMFDGNGSGFEISLLGLGLIFTLLANCYIGILNGHHKIKLLAKIAIANSVCWVILLIFFVWLFNVKGLIFGVVGASIVNFALSFYFYKWQIPVSGFKVSYDNLTATLKSLLKFGIPFTASLAVGSGVQLLLPLLILHQLDIENVGYYRAALAISVTSLSLILNAMGQDYYPRLSGVSDNKELLIKAVNEQLYFALLLFSPILLWLLLLSPNVVLFLYSAEFSKTSEILSIMLIGDIFKLLSWMLAFIILARNRSGLYFFSELTFGVGLLAASYFGIQYFGVIGVSIGYAVGYFFYFLVVWYFVKREIDISFNPKNKFLILCILILASSVFVLSKYATSNINLYFSIGLCVAASLVSIIYFVNQFYREGKEETLINE